MYCVSISARARRLSLLFYLFVDLTKRMTICLFTRVTVTSSGPFYGIQWCCETFAWPGHNCWLLRNAEIRKHFAVVSDKGFPNSCPASTNNINKPNSDRRCGPLFCYKMNSTIGYIERKVISGNILLHAWMKSTNNFNILTSIKSYTYFKLYLFYNESEAHKLWEVNKDLSRWHSWRRFCDLTVKRNWNTLRSHTCLTRWPRYTYPVIPRNYMRNV